MIQHWINHNYKKLILAGVIIVLVIIVGVGAHKGKVASDPYYNVKVEYEKEDEGGNIRKVLDEYYNAYANNDVNTLMMVASPLTDLEKSYVEFMSGLVNEYKINEVYSKQANDSGCYLVSVYVQIDFKELDKLAPGLDFFYMKTDDEGEIYIDNTYSTFNRTFVEMELNKDISALISTFSRQQDVMDLQVRVDTDFNEIYESDEAFKAFFDGMPAQLSAWRSGYDEALAKKEEEAKAAAEAKAEEERKAAEEAAKAEEEKKAAEEAAKEEANAVMVVATDNVNVRDSVSEEANKLGQIDKGTVFKKYSEDGEWSKIDYNGQKGYVKTEYIKPYEENSDNNNQEAEATDNSEEQAQTGGNGYTTGDTITANDILNVRREPNTDGEKLDVAMPGDTLKVIEDQNGSEWIKVEFKNKQGYIKADVL